MTTEYKQKVKNLKLENLMPAKDGLITLERSLANNSQNNRRSNFCWPRGRWPSRHHWGERNVPEKVLNADESALFWDKMPQRTFISKEEKWAPWFKVGSDRLTNSSVLCKYSWVSDQDCWLYKKNLNNHPFFWNWFHQCVIPKVRKLPCQ